MRNKIVKRVDEGELVCIYAHLAIVKSLSMKSLSLVLAISINQTWQLGKTGPIEDIVSARLIVMLLRMARKPIILDLEF